MTESELQTVYKGRSGSLGTRGWPAVSQLVFMETKPHVVKYAADGNSDAEGKGAGNLDGDPFSVSQACLSRLLLIRVFYYLLPSMSSQRRAALIQREV